MGVEISCITLPVSLTITVLLDYRKQCPSFLVLMRISVWAYLIWRMVVFVEMFWSLRSAPVDVFQVPQWTQNLLWLG